MNHQERAADLVARAEMEARHGTKEGYVLALALGGLTHALLAHLDAPEETKSRGPG